jgi:hypothetical protein
MGIDPVETNPQVYRVVFENERVRVLEYRDAPGESTTPHAHPDSVMITLSSFRRLLSSAGREAEVEIDAGSARWLDAQEHSGHNIRGQSDPRHVRRAEGAGPRRPSPRAPSQPGRPLTPRVDQTARVSGASAFTPRHRSAVVSVRFS